MITWRPGVVLNAIPEAKYITEPGASVYRILVGHIYDQRELGIGWVTRPALVAAARARLDPEAAAAYDERQCEADLNQLTTWGTLVRQYNMLDVRSVEDFTQKQLKYALTPIAAVFEEGLRLFASREGSRGALDPSLLQNLWADLLGFDALIAVPVTSAASPERAALRDAWTALYARFERLRKTGVEFQSVLTEQADTPNVQLDALVAYKQVLQQNLTAFGSRLREYTDAMRERVESWRSAAVPQWLVPALGADDLERVVRQELPPSLYEIEAHYLNQFKAIAEWLAPRRRNTEGLPAGGGAAHLADAMATAVQRAIEDTRRLTEQLIAGDSRRRDLAILARCFAACLTPADAHRLAGVACGVMQPKHLAADPHPEIDPAVSVWDQEPQTVALRSLVRGGGPRGKSAPLIDTIAEQEAMLAEASAGRARERADWARLFATGPVVLTDLWLDSHALRTEVLGVISQCLSRGDRTGQAPDGSRIFLERAASDAPLGRIRTRHGGAIWVPQYRLTRTEAAEVAA